MILCIATAEDKTNLPQLFETLDAENPLPVGKTGRFSQTELPDETGFLAVAKDDGGLFAFVSAVRRNASCEVTLGITRSHQNRGIARMLFALLEDWAFENGIGSAQATIYSGSYLPLHVFARHGFEGAKREGEMLTLTRTFPQTPRYVKPAADPNELLNWPFTD